jgi:putative transposase
MAKRYDPDRHHRRAIRLPQYDYRRAGAYFVTICTRERECVLDDPVVRGIVTDVWQALPARFPTIALDAFVVMPNHVHLIVWLHPSDAVAQGAEAGGVGTTLAVAQRAEASDVGATLAVALTSVAPMVADERPAGETQKARAYKRAGASPAPTEGLGDPEEDGVGATLAVALPAVAPTAVDPIADAAWHDWTIPEPKEIKENPTLGDVMGAFKSLIFIVYLDWIERHDPTRQAKFWQRNYYEHIIRNERELKAIRQYIADNPARWAQDTYNPATAGPDPHAVDLWRLLQEGAG